MRNCHGGQGSATSKCTIINTRDAVSYKYSGQGSATMKCLTTNNRDAIR